MEVCGCERLCSPTHQAEPVDSTAGRVLLYYCDFWYVDMSSIERRGRQCGGR